MLANGTHPKTKYRRLSPVAGGLKQIVISGIKNGKHLFKKERTKSGEKNIATSKGFHLWHPVQHLTADHRHRTGVVARHHHSTTRMGGDNKTRPLEKNPAVPGRSELDIYYTVYTVTIATCETSSINSEGKWARQRENNKQKSHQGFFFFKVHYMIILQLTGILLKNTQLTNSPHDRKQMTFAKFSWLFAFTLQQEK